MRPREGEQVTFLDALVVLECLACQFVIIVWIFAGVMVWSVLPIGHYLKDHGLEILAWIGIPIAWFALMLALASLVMRSNLPDFWRRVVTRVDEALPESAVVARAMRWWSVFVLAATAFVCARLGGSIPLRHPGPVENLNLDWLWVAAGLALPLLLLSHVVNNRPPPRDEEIQRIAVRMALSDQVVIGFKKYWIIGGQPVDPESEQGQKWLYVATMAHLWDAAREYDRIWGVDADRKTHPKGG